MASEPQQYETSGMAIRPEDMQLSPYAEALLEVEQTLGYTLETLARPSNLVARLNSELERRRRRREPLEKEWIDAYRRYSNEYDPSTKARFKPNKSKLWVGLTAMKCNAAHAAISEFLAQGSWDLEPAPIPDDVQLHPLLEQMGVGIPLLREEVRRRTTSLKDEMERQLDESDYPEHLDMALLECIITGSGAIKGPITERDEQEDWEMELSESALTTGDISDMVMVPKKRDAFRPAMSYVSVFNLYPDMDTQLVHRGQGIFEEMYLTRGQMIELARQPGFDTLSILKVLKEKPRGNANLVPHQITMRRMAGDADPQATERYKVVVYHGPVSGGELEAAGAKMGDGIAKFLEMQGCVWYCDQYVLKAREYKGKLPYYIFPYVRRAGFGPYGIGIPMLGKNSQDAINAAARIMLDNAAIASGPFIEANMRLLEPGEDPTDLHAWRVFLSKHDGNQSKKAISVYDIPAYTGLFIQIIDMFRRTMDEETFMPSITGGQEMSVGNETATGMSILNSNANRSLKQVMRNVDAYCIEPFIEAWYEWNMRYNTRTDILAKMQPVAKGVASLVAKEMQAMRLMQFVQTWNGHPDFKSTNAMREHAEALEVDPDQMVVTEEEKLGMTAQDLVGGAMGRGAPGAPGGMPPALPQDGAPLAPQGAVPGQTPTGPTGLPLE
jgi:hypothetical protein